VDRAKLGKLLMIILGFPIAVLILSNCIANYIPPTEAYKKTPKQFEELFNEKMAQYGMSIDVEGGEYSFTNAPRRTVQIFCEDGSKVSCTYYPTGTGSRSIIQYLVFEQELSGKENETVYLEKLFAL